jgi:WD40 repeat protein
MFGLVCSALSFDGSYIAECSSVGRVEVWDTKLQQPLSAFNTMIEEVEGFGPCASIVLFLPSISHSSSGHAQLLLATAGSDRQLRLWRVDGRLHLTFPYCTNKIVCMAHSTDGRYGVTGGGDGWDVGEIRLWNLATGQCLYNFNLKVRCLHLLWYMRL